MLYIFTNNSKNLDKHAKNQYLEHKLRYKFRVILNKINMYS